MRLRSLRERGGKFLRSWGDDYLHTPHGLRIDHEQNVWITDIGNHQVLKFDRAGKRRLQRSCGGSCEDQPRSARIRLHLLCSSITGPISTVATSPFSTTTRPLITV